MGDKDDVKADVNENGEPPKKSSAMLIIIIVAVVVLGAGGYVGWSMFLKGGDTATQEESQATPPRSEAKAKKASIICPLDSFIVNLADKRGLGKRYLKISMELEVYNEEDKVSITNHIPQLRDTILLLLSSMSFKEINTIDGKLVLKKALLSNIKQVLGSKMVQNVYFSDFVVQ